VLKRALATTPRLYNNITTIWTIPKNLHDCSQKVFGDHWKNEKSNKEHNR